MSVVIFYATLGHRKISWEFSLVIQFLKLLITFRKDEKNNTLFLHFIKMNSELLLKVFILFTVGQGRELRLPDLAWDVPLFVCLFLVSSLVVSRSQSSFYSATVFKERKKKKARAAKTYIFVISYFIL